MLKTGSLGHYHKAVNTACCQRTCDLPVNTTGGQHLIYWSDHYVPLQGICDLCFYSCKWKIGSTAPPNVRMNPILTIYKRIPLLCFPDIDCIEPTQFWMFNTLFKCKVDLFRVAPVWASAEMMFAFLVSDSRVSNAEVINHVARLVHSSQQGANFYNLLGDADILRFTNTPLTCLKYTTDSQTLCSHVCFSFIFSIFVKIKQHQEFFPAFHALIVDILQVLG